MDHLIQVFVYINSYPKWFIYQISVEKESGSLPLLSNWPKQLKKIRQINSLYVYLTKVVKVKKMKNLKNSLANTETRITFKGSRLNSKFSIKERIKTLNVVHEENGPDCEATDIGGTGGRLGITAEEDAGTDKNSHLLRHSKKIGHSRITMPNMKIIGSNYRN